MWLLAFSACTASDADDSSGSPTDTVPVDRVEALAYVDVAGTWGFFDTTDDLPFPDEGNGVAIADLDEDGRDDVLLASRDGDVWVNWSREDGFVSESLGLFETSNHAVAVDVDGDRHLDVVASGRRDGMRTILILQGDGAGGFRVPTTGDSSLPPSVGGMLDIDATDVDLDGDVDLYLTSQASDDFLLNDGNGRFTSIRDALDLDTWTWLSWTGLFADFDLDGRPDFFVANDLQANNYRSRLYRGDGDGGFVEAECPTTVDAMGASAFDYDGDGDEDVLVTSTGGDSLSRNDGAGGWVDVSLAANARGTLTIYQMHMGTVATDLDNDGWTDLVLAGGRAGVDEAILAQQDLIEPDSFLRNTGAAAFVEMADTWGVQDDRDGRAVAAGDLDGDGTVEIVLTNMGVPSRVWRSPPIQARAVDVELVGRTSNAYGLGARVELTAGGRTQTSWMRLLQGLLSAGPPRVHFGVGDAPIESLVVIWPGERRQEVPIAADHRGRLVVEEE